MSNDWGVGNRAGDKAFDTALVEGKPVELIFGEHPHSRSDNTIYARFSPDRIEGFDGHRVCTRIEIAESNYLKESELSGDEVRKGGSVKVYFNDLLVFEGFVRSWERGMQLARNYIDKVFSGSFPIQPWKKEEWDGLKGRKVYYREIPAVIDMVIRDQGCVILVPEGVKAFPPTCYEREDGDYDEYEHRSAKVEIDCPHIWWWRK